MPTCRICNEPVSAGDSTCPKHVGTDPSKRAMIGLPDEMQHTPPSNARAPTPATAVLRIPLTDGHFADAPTPVVNTQVAARLEPLDAARTEAFLPPAPFGPAQPPPVVDPNHPDAIATSVFRVPSMPASRDEPSTTVPSGMRLQIPIAPPPVRHLDESETEAPTDLAVRPLKAASAEVPPPAPVVRAELPPPPPPQPAPARRAAGTVVFAAIAVVAAMVATAALVVTRAQLKATQADVAARRHSPEKHQAAVEALVAYARSGALPSQIDALAGGFAGSGDEPRLLLARGLAHLHAGNWSVAIELLSKLEDDEAKAALAQAREASLTDER